MDLIQGMIEDLKRENEYFFEACKKESDRGLALVAAEFFDATLERLLRARFSPGLKNQPKLIKPLFEGFGPLSTFSSKISVSYAIDLLQDWMASDLDLIRRIRNDFAHSLESKTFRDPNISRMVGQLASFAKAIKSVEKTNETRASKQPRQDIFEDTSRNKFVVACTRTGALLQAKVVVLESDGPDDMKRSFMIDPKL